MDRCQSMAQFQWLGQNASVFEVSCWIVFHVRIWQHTHVLVCGICAHTGRCIQDDSSILRAVVGFQGEALREMAFDVVYRTSCFIFALEVLLFVDGKIFGASHTEEPI